MNCLQLGSSKIKTNMIRYSHENTRKNFTIEYTASPNAHNEQAGGGFL